MTSHTAKIFAITLPLLCCAFVAVADSTASAPGTARDFSLSDQFRTKHDIQFPCEQVCILLMADWESKDDVGGWYYPLHETYADKPVMMHGVGAAKDCPLLLRPVLRTLLRKHVDEPIMLDWKDEVIEAYDFERGAVNIYVISAEGEVLLHVHGKANEDDLEAIHETLDIALEAVPLPTE